MNPILLTDVTMRDGLQSEAKLLSTSQKVMNLKSLLQAGFDQVQLTSFAHPQRVPQLADAENVIDQLTEHPEFQHKASALVLNPRGLARALATEIPQIDFTVSADPAHSLKNVGKAQDQVFQETLSGIQEARAAGRRVRLGINTVWGSGNKPTSQIKFAEALMSALEPDSVNSVFLADSSGCATPTQIQQACVWFQSQNFDFDLGFHLHDTFGRALLNTHIAWSHGVRRFDVSLGGLGGCPFIAGAKGNLDCLKLVDLWQKESRTHNLNRDALIRSQKRLFEQLGKTLPWEPYYAESSVFDSKNSRGETSQPEVRA